MAGHLRLELWALPRTGDPYPLPDLEKWSVGPRDDEPGLLEFRYPTTTGRYADRLVPIVDDDVDLRVEARLVRGDGESWSDVFIVDEADLDDVEESGLATFRGLAQSTLFDEVVIPYHPAPAGEEGETGQGETPAFGSAGRIAREFLTAAQGRGCLDGITWSFTDSHDSNGDPWAREGTLRFSPGQTYRAMLGTLRGYQLADWELTADRELRLVNVSLEDGYGIGTDLTTGPDPVTLERGRDLADGPRKWRIRGAITALFSSGKDGLYTSASDTTAAARRGRRVEGYHSFGNTADAGTLAALTQRRLGTQTRGKVEVSHAVTLGAGPTPLIDYRPGDRLYSATRHGVDKRRVRQITVDGEADNAVSVAVTAGDLLDEAAVRQQQQIDAIATGEAIAGTSTPPPDVDDGSVPAAPTGLVATSLWFANNEGAGECSVTAVWVGVPDARVEGYVLEWRYLDNPLGTVWRRMPQTDAATLSWSSMSPGKGVEVHVAAVNKWGRFSDWSTPYQFMTEEDGTPPAVPAAPTPFVELGFVVVPWDGTGSSGEPMPGDFWRVEVHRSTTSNFTPHRPVVAGSLQLDEAASTTYRGELRGATQLTDEADPAHREIPANPDDPADPGQPGTLYYYRLVAVDRTGNASAASAQASVMPRGIQGDEIESLAVSKLRAGVIRALVGIGDKLYAGNPNGAGWEGDAAGFRFYSMIGGVRTTVLEFIASTAQLLITGTFQTGKTGARAILSGSPARLRFYPSNDETRYGEVTSYIPAEYPDAIAVEMASSRAASAASVAHIQAVPGVAAMTLSAPTGADRSYAEVLLNENVMMLGLLTGNADRGKRGGWLWLDRYNGSTGQVIAALEAYDWSPTTATAPHGRMRGAVQIMPDLIRLDMPGGAALEVKADGYIMYRRSNGGWYELAGNGGKTFVIPHPLDDPDQPDRWLVHATTESPVAAVEYTGEQVVDEIAVVDLPDYFDALVEPDGRTVQCTLVDDGGPLAHVAAGPVRGNRFTIRTDANRPVRVAWHVRGARRDTSFEVEPRRDDYYAMGDGPYRYLIPKEGDAA